MGHQDYKVIAVCLADINEGYNIPFLEAFNRHAQAHNLKVLYFNSFSALFYMEKHDIGESNIYQLINYNLIDGLVLLSQSIKSQSILQEILDSAAKHKVPVVSIDLPLDSCYNIRFDNDAIGQIAEHLITKHHVSRFNFVSGFRDNLYSEHRLNAFRKVLADHGLTIEDERIGYGEFWDGPTNKVMDDFFASELPFPEAIVCANDSMAVTVISRLLQAGYRVPEDVIVTGFDGIREALEHSPSITTAQHDFDKAVLACYQIFSELFNGKTPKTDYVITPKLLFGGSCGCVVQSKYYHNELHRILYNEIDSNKVFSNAQIRMTADLMDKNSFQEVFDAIRTYVEEEFSNDYFWLCIVDNFLTQEELSDIIEENRIMRRGYSNKVDLMLCRKHGEWQGMTDFATEQLLPSLEDAFGHTDSIIFFPLHVHDQNIGYVAISFKDEMLNISHYYQFFMNISNALEVTKSRLRQQMIIQTLENKYVHDPLTGLYNRRGFYQKIQPQYNKCVQKQLLFMIASVDLNGLKVINDTYGHADGDIAISTAAKALAANAPESVVCARFGGDEFVVAGQLATEKEGEDFLQKIRDYLQHFNETSGKPYEVSASIGLLQAVPNDSVTLDEFISHADELMYSEKAKHHLSRGR